ncbi:sigma-54 interaction domain-containing protein [Bacilliculturomica massiliensis]|uniref:sigma-54 interaction domain-containing protein n=1 Tax=Bacilliculturomica massiliensis TaxID=1917867 RepID=UPI0013EF4F55|nr:sigma 54-interacting transcriptional regulator [Bacilliculturomica massiliensis]
MEEEKWEGVDDCCLGEADYRAFAAAVCEAVGAAPSDAESREGLERLGRQIRSLQGNYWILHTACEYSADSIHITDGKGNTLFVNKVFEERVGIPREKILQRNVKDIEKEELYYPSVVALAIKEQRKLTMTQAAHGSTTITTSTPVFDEEGNIVLVVSNARPVEELKLLHDFFQRREEPHELTGGRPQLIYRSGQMAGLMDLLDRVAPVDSAVLLTGESGTGKSVLAHYIHIHSGRADGKFVKINCAAIPETLLESELFGYESGAFTGAKQGGKRGLIEVANGGTLFLDEIGDMPLMLQAKLLQVIQYGEIQRIGGEEPIRVDIRVISATNQNLERMMEEGRFRSDLFYRLNVVPVRVPALRQRPEDIAPLTEAFLQYNNEKYQKNVVFSYEVMECFYHYQWPGNIRELENLVERLVVTNRSGLVSAPELPTEFCVYFSKEQKPIVVNSPIRLQDALEEVERQLVRAAYAQLGSSYKVAKQLGISQSGASRRIQKYVLESWHEKKK